MKRAGVVISRRDAAVMIALIVVGGLITILWGERIGVNDGKGWDGQAYVAWARDFPEWVRHGVTTYQSQRMVPSAIIYGALWVLDIAPTDAHILVAFQVLDLAALVVSALALIRIAGVLAWSRAATWAAFAATFLSFSVARHALYYPDLTDPSAFALGMALVLAYLERRMVATAVIALVAAFTWPVLLWPALVALVAPRPCEPLPPVTARWVKPAAAGLAIVAAAITVAWLVEYWSWPHLDHLTRVAHVELFPLSVGCAAGVTGAAMFALVREPRAWAVVPFARSLASWRTMIAAAVAIAIIVAARTWADRVGTAGSGATLEYFLGFAAASAMHGPLWGPGGQVIYWGPIVLLAMLAWPRVAAVVAQWGPAAVFAFAMAVMLAVSPEGRHLTHLMPFIIVATIHATASWWDVRRAIVFAALCLPWSKLWLTIGYDRAVYQFAFPNQRYFMQFGEYANDATFAAHLVAAGVTLLVLAIVLRRPLSSGDEARSDRDPGGGL
jgi:hypothetical protein